MLYTAVNRTPNRRQNIKDVRFTHLVMAHVRLGPVQQTLELQTVGVPVGDHIAHLSDYCGEDEYANQVADDRKDVSAEEGGGDVIFL